MFIGFVFYAIVVGIPALLLLAWALKSLEGLLKIITVVIKGIGYVLNGIIHLFSKAQNSVQSKDGSGTADTNE